MKLAKAEAIYKPNLLINGDFKINIRNQTTYSADTIWTYTLPMWRINNGKLYVNEGFVRFHRETSTNNAYLNQVVATKSDSICVVKVKEISGNAVIRFGDSTVTKTVSDSGIYIVYNPQSISTVAIELPDQNSYIDIEYIDLFDGDIAYSHVEEDDAISQMRCEKHVLKLPTSYSGYTGSTSYIYFVSEKLMEMASTPSVDVIPTTIRCVFEGGVTAYNISNITVNKASGEINVQVTSPPSSLASKSIGGWFDKNIILSCEP